MYRRKLLALAVSVAALAVAATPAGAAPVRPDANADQIIAVLIGLQVQPPVLTPGSSPTAAGFFKHLSGFDSETEGLMDYTDDVPFKA
jgi:hypothetical protein